MPELTSQIKFVHKTEGDKYKVWVYEDHSDLMVTLYEAECKIRDKAGREQLYKKAKRVYAHYLTPETSWHEAG